jgi:pyruvate/2-oxoacid:ferredoxin oxidoreductase alpha subunit
MEERQDLFDDLIKSKKLISQTAKEFEKKFKRKQRDGLIEYIGSGEEEVVLAAMGSVVGTMREVQSPESTVQSNKFGILKIRSFRPFPDGEVIKALSKAKYVAVVDKSVSLGTEGVLASEVKRVVFGKVRAKISSFIVGLGGKDVTPEIIEKIVLAAREPQDGARFIYP